jgi:hypothetical protein
MPYSDVVNIIGTPTADMGIQKIWYNADSSFFTAMFNDDNQVYVTVPMNLPEMSACIVEHINATDIKEWWTNLNERFKKNGYDVKVQMHPDGPHFHISNDSVEHEMTEDQLLSMYFDSYKSHLIKSGECKPE